MTGQVKKKLKWGLNRASPFENYGLAHESGRDQCACGRCQNPAVLKNEAVCMRRQHHSVWWVIDVTRLVNCMALDMKI